MKTVFVTDDWVTDWNLARPANLPEGYFDASLQTQLYHRAGGAWFVAHLIENVSCRDFTGLTLGFERAKSTWGWLRVSADIAGFSKTAVENRLFSLAIARETLAAFESAGFDLRYKSPRRGKGHATSHSRPMAGR